MSIYFSFPSDLSSSRRASNLSFTNFKKIRLNTTCLYSAGSTVPRSLSQAPQSASSKPTCFFLFGHSKSPVFECFIRRYITFDFIYVGVIQFNKSLYICFLGMVLNPSTARAASCRLPARRLHSLPVPSMAPLPPYSVGARLASNP